ncbi:MAG: rhomboid family intramembrane serine protease [Bacteroidetes bacterium]|nr:rhomboid family intramembrane serine protease [Bacteroidota bacterium]
MPGLKKHLVLLNGLFPFTFVVLLWLIQLAQGFLQQDWGIYSVNPRTAGGLIGIFTSPLLHAGWKHLIGNTVPLLVLGFLLFNSYREIAGKVFWLIYLLNGILLWLFARSAIHLGASGVVYGMASFLLFSGFIRRHQQLAMLSFLVIFLYGSLVWGIFPFDPHVSWEAHLYGGLTGLVLAIVLRKEGPQPKKYFQEEEEETETNPENEAGTNEKFPSENDNNSQMKIIYSYKEKNENTNADEDAL